jgi:hypothetical protein
MGSSSIWKSPERRRRDAKRRRKYLERQEAEWAAMASEVVVRKATPEEIARFTK